VTIAHGVGVYSLNPYAVTTSPIQGAWGSAEQQTFEAKKREKLLWDAHKIILEDAPAVPLWNSMDIYAHRADLVWTAPPDEKVHLKQAYFKAK
jgi:ABC-type transport system substrate-binding protein